MTGTGPFQLHHQRYEAWFSRHEAVFLSELLALRPFVPWEGRGCEIGVGTGRFAAPLGVGTGIDPSPAMLEYAAARGIEVVQGRAEQMPFGNATFDYILAVTTLCFVESPSEMLSEARRVLKPGGRLIIGFVDKQSDLGREYLAHQSESVFYREAVFFSADEVEQLLRRAGFIMKGWGQTLSQPLAETQTIEPLRPGHGQSAFVVAAARTPT